MLCVNACGVRLGEPKNPNIEDGSGQTICFFRYFHIFGKKLAESTKIKNPSKPSDLVW